MPKVFIGMPVYNGERFLREAIASLRAQTFVDWKILISDDASTDGSQAICEEYAQRDSRISYVRQEKNIGMFPNFKFLIDKADGKYFMWAAQDDIREKDYVEICISNLEKNRGIGLATTILTTIDSSGQSNKEESDLIHLSGEPSYLLVARYVLQPEILGKCNIMYSLFRTNVVRETWRIYPQRKEWGSDYHFSLAAISHFGIIVESKILFKKRYGGFSSPTLKTRAKIKDPKNHMFPFGRFTNYFRGHMEALAGTPYRPLAAILLFIRLPRAFLIYLKERNYQRFLTI